MSEITINSWVIVTIPIATSIITGVFTLLGIFLTNRNNERRESEKKDELRLKEEEKYEREKRMNFYNSYLDLINARAVLVRIEALIIAKDYDVSKIMEEVNKIKSDEIIVLNKNIYLNKKELALAASLNSIKIMKDSLGVLVYETVVRCNCIENGIEALKKFKDLNKKKIEKLLIEVYEYLFNSD